MDSASSRAIGSGSGVAGVCEEGTVIQVILALRATRLVLLLCIYNVGPRLAYSIDTLTLCRGSCKALGCAVRDGSPDPNHGICFRGLPCTAIVDASDALNIHAHADYIQNWYSMLYRAV